MIASREDNRLGFESVEQPNQKFRAQDEPARVLTQTRDYAAVAASKSFSAEKTVKLDLLLVHRPQELEIREAQDPEQVADFETRYDELDKGSVLWVEDKWVLVDGWDRLQAALNLGRKTDTFTNLGKGSMMDALRLRVQANRKHGRRLTREDWVKLTWRVMEEGQKENPKFNTRNAADFLGIPAGTIEAYVRYPEGRHHAPVDHPFSTRPTASIVRRKRKTELDVMLDQARSLISSGAGVLKRAAAKYPLKQWKPEQKKSLSRIMAALKPFME